MKYYSTSGSAPLATLEEAVVNGLAPDKGLYLPVSIPQIDRAFLRELPHLSLPEVAYGVATVLFGDDIDKSELKRIVFETMSFDIPLTTVEKNIYSLELFHGPTAAFKDVGARFMARVLGYFTRKERERRITVLVATSGDTGSAVANGFLGVPGVDVIVLYPEGLVSDIQEKQFTTLGQNVTALEVRGTFDDCQSMVKSAFMDSELKKSLNLTSANSINIARFLPQSFYYFYAYGQIKSIFDKRDSSEIPEVVFSVPSGNFGNLCAGLVAKRMGLPVKRFIAANNSNDIVCKYLESGKFEPRASVATIANAMDVGNPSNFERILDLCSGSHEAVKMEISGKAYSDSQIAETITGLYNRTGYLADPHGACGYRALSESLSNGEVGVFLETAHPAKFRDTILDIAGLEVEIPERLAAYMRGKKQSIPISAGYDALRSFLKQSHR